jgi:hydrogenase maturation protease
MDAKTMMFGIRPTLILGIGNILLGDEGVGVRTVEAMSKLDLPNDVELIDGGTGGADLVDILADRRRVIVIDAMQAGVEAGTIRRMSVDELSPFQGNSVSLHELGLVESLHMAGLLGCAPRDVIVFGIQPRQIAPGLELSAEAAAAVPRVIAAVLAELVET